MSFLLLQFQMFLQRPALASRCRSALAAYAYKYGWCPVAQISIYSHHTAFSIDSKTCFTFMSVLNGQQWQLETEICERQKLLTQEHTAPRLSLHTIFFLAHSLHSLAFRLTQLVTVYAVCRYLFIAEHTNLACKKQLSEEQWRKIYTSGYLVCLSFWLLSC